MCKTLPDHNRKLLQYEIALLLGPHVCSLVLSPTPVLVKVDLLIVDLVTTAEALPLCLGVLICPLHFFFTFGV